MALTMLRHLNLEYNDWWPGPQTGTDLHLDPPFANSWNTVLRGWDWNQLLPILLGVWPTQTYINPLETLTLTYSYQPPPFQEISFGCWRLPTSSLPSCNATLSALDPTMRWHWPSCSCSSCSSWWWSLGVPPLLVHPCPTSAQGSTLVWKNRARG